MACLAVVTVSAQTYKEGMWYSLYDDTEHLMNTQGDFEAEGIFAPTAGKLNVQWKYEWIDWLGAFKKIDTQVLESADNGGSTNQVGALTENTDNNSVTTESFIVGKNINWIKFNRTGLPTHKVILQRIDIPLAKHILLDNGKNGASKQSNDFGELEVLATSEPYQVKFRSFLTTGDITITSSLPTIFRVGAVDNTKGLTYAVGDNACASANGNADAAGGSVLGKIANYDFAIYFTPEEAGMFEGVITITDGTSSAEIEVSGAANKLAQSVTWETEAEILTKDTIKPANASSGLEVKYAFEPENIVKYEENAFVILSEGVVTITASQEGNGQYEAAQPVSKTITIYPAETHYKYTRAICAGEEYTDENFSDLTKSELYYDTLKTIHGGDSIICLSLTVNPLYHFEESNTIKEGDAGIWQNIDLSLLPVGDTALVAEYHAVTGCDSTYLLHLTVKPHIISYGNDTISLCAGDTAVYDGKIYRQATKDSVLLSQPNQYGDDSIVELVIYVHPVLHITLTNTIAQGDPETWEDIDLSVLPVGDTTLVANYTSVHGCDSTYVLHLTVEQKREEGIHVTDEADGTARKELHQSRLYIRKGEEIYDSFGRKVTKK